MFSLEPPCQANKYHDAHVSLLLDSYQRLLNQPLLELKDGQSLGRQVFEADFALLSHNADSDPLFNYGNRTALDLFELSWGELIGMPSRLSVEPVAMREREQLMAKVAANGFIAGYSGVRISGSGKRFLIQRAVVWNVYDSQLKFYGQAAFFKDWTLLP